MSSSIKLKKQLTEVAQIMDALQKMETEFGKKTPENLLYVQVYADGSGGIYQSRANNRDVELFSFEEPRQLIDFASAPPIEKIVMTHL